MPPSDPWLSRENAALRRKGHGVSLDLAGARVPGCVCGQRCRRGLRPARCRAQAARHQHGTCRSGPGQRGPAAGGAAWQGARASPARSKSMPARSRPLEVSSAEAQFSLAAAALRASPSSLPLASLKGFSPPIEDLAGPAATQPRPVGHGPAVRKDAGPPARSRGWLQPVSKTIPSTGVSGALPSVPRQPPWPFRDNQVGR